MELPFGEDGGLIYSRACVLMGETWPLRILLKRKSTLAFFFNQYAVDFHCVEKSHTSKYKIEIIVCLVSGINFLGEAVLNQWLVNAFLATLLFCMRKALITSLVSLLYIKC